MVLSLNFCNNRHINIWIRRKRNVWSNWMTAEQSLEKWIPDLYTVYREWYSGTHVALGLSNKITLSVSLHSPNGRHLPVVRAVQGTAGGLWEIRTGPVSPEHCDRGIPKSYWEQTVGPLYWKPVDSHHKGPAIWKALSCYYMIHVPCDVVQIEALSHAARVHFNFTCVLPERCIVGVKQGCPLWPCGDRKDSREMWDSGRQK